MSIASIGRITTTPIQSFAVTKLQRVEVDASEPDHRQRGDDEDGEGDVLDERAAIEELEVEVPARARLAVSGRARGAARARASGRRPTRPRC